MKRIVQDASQLFSEWVIDAQSSLAEEGMFQHLHNYLTSTHPQICGKCTPCREGIVKLEDILIAYIQGKATMKSLHQFEQITYNLRASLCDVGVDIGRNLEVVLRNNYHTLYHPVKDYRGEDI